MNRLHPMPTVRPAAERDVEFIDALAIRLGLNVDARSELEHGRLVFVAEVSDGGCETRAGFASFQLAGGELEIYDVGVVPELQRRGIASRLVETALRELANRAPGAVFLEVRPSNTAAVALYASLGFEFVGQRRGYYSDGEDAWIGRRDLSGEHAVDETLAPEEKDS